MVRWQSLDWYDECRAYDVVFDSGTADEAEFLVAAHARYATGEAAPATARRRRRRPAALEPACGTGRLVLAMAERGWSIAGYDLNPAALAYARARLAGRGVRAALSHGAMQSWQQSRRVDLAFNLVSSFKYLLTEADAVAHLQRTAAMLRPGGLYVLGLHLTDYGDRSRQRERWVATRDGVRVTAVIETGVPDRRRRTEAMRARLTMVRAGRGRRRSARSAAAAAAEQRFETTWTFRTYGPRQLRSLLATVPQLECVAVHDFRHRIDEPIRFGGDHLDHVLILRRTADAAGSPPGQRPSAR